MSKTAVLEARVDLRDLAICARYFTERQLVAKSKSELLNIVISAFAEVAKQHGTVPFESTEEALGYMYSINLGPVNRIKRDGERRGNVLTLAKAIADERLLETTIMNTLSMKHTEGETVPKEVDDVTRAMEILNSLEDKHISSTFENRMKEDNE